MLSRRVAFSNAFMLVLGSAVLSFCVLGPCVPALAQSPAGKVTVVTSFSKDVTEPFKKAFEDANPGLQLEVQNRNTNAGVRFVQETKANNQVDLFWASAPDAFEVLKKAGLLQSYRPEMPGIPAKIGPYPISDADGMFFGFAASGYGIMWNERYMRANRLPEPKEWSDLTKAVYHDHIMITSPSRSGTTHLTIETILQGEGWEKGWATIKRMSGNLRSVTDRSFGVPDAVNSGQVGLGVVIDFFAFSARAAKFPVKFVYPSVSTVVPANIGIVANAPNQAGARAFVNFVLSNRGQELLLIPAISRLPVNPAIYAKAPEDYPNPFKGTIGLAGFQFDVGVSERRYTAVDVLFDQLITFNLEPLKAATKAIHDVEARLTRKDNPAARALLAEAVALITAMPMSAAEVTSDEVRTSFQGASGATKAPRQAEIEQGWSSFAKEKYAIALAKANEAGRLAP